MNRIKQLLKIVSLVVTCGVLNSLTVYAGWESFTVEVDKPVGPGSINKESNVQWKYKKDGEYLKSTDFIDVDGNIYTFDENGIMLKDITVDKKIYSEDGVLQNGLKRDKRLDAELTKWTQGDNHLARFDSMLHKDIFLMYTYLYFSDTGEILDDKGEKVLYFYVYDDGFSIINEPNVRSSLVDTTVEELAKQVVGNTLTERVESAIKLAGTKLDGDYDKILGNDSMSLHKVLETGKSTCVGYTLLTHRILEKIGIESELCLGYTTKSNLHLWIRVNKQQCETTRVNCHHKEHWLYADPSWYNGWGTRQIHPEHFDIEYDRYLEVYKMHSYY